MTNPKPRPQGWDVKTSYRGPAKQNNKRVDLDPQAFDLLIQQKGVRVKVYLTTLCPNVKSIDGAEHQIDCNCNGSGFLDLHPICTLAFIQNQGLEKLPEVEGLVDGNSITATFPTGIELQYFTLVELEDFTEQFFQRVKRQTAKSDVLKYKAKRVHLCVDSNFKEYFQDIDFLLDNSTGSINWLPNRGPDPETIYSVRYDAAVQFRAVRGMHNNRFTQFFTSSNGGGAIFTKMPEEWMLSKEFLLKRKNSDGTELLPNLILGPTDPDEPSDPIER